MFFNRLPLITMLACLGVGLLCPPQAVAGSSDDAQRIKLRARLSNADGMSARVEYKQKAKHDELQRRFKVKVKEGPANATLDVVVNGDSIGEMFNDMH